VPENKKLDDLLKEFQEKKVHLAIVVDEYGGTSGVVSLEDVVEEIIGDINDEFDDESLIYSKLDNYNYVFDGKTSLKDIYRVLDLDAELFEENKGEAETIAGFVLEISGSFPKKNEKIIFNGYIFSVESLDSKRIKQLKVSLPK
jgi:CBS domain containing-hemolysin-like protein